jgi:hypothetical protein
MNYGSDKRVEHHECPKHIQERLTIAGGLNRFGEPNFRCVWGFNRVVPVHGEWQDWEMTELISPRTGMPIPLYKGSVIETRMCPRYYRGNVWILEKWCPPEQYGSPDLWKKQGEEVVNGQVIDTAGEFPTRGDYELAFYITADLQRNGDFIPLNATVAEWLVQLIVKSREISMAQNRAQIVKECEKEEKDFVEQAVDVMKDGLRPFAGETFITVPGSRVN